MKLYSSNKDYKLYHGNMLDMLEVIEPNSIDSIICDPPYGLTSITKRFGKEDSAECQYGKDGSFQRLSKGFMGKEWDGSGIEYNVDAWGKCYQVLKPGGYLLAFGGSRTFHRIACAIEDAGFEIRDTIMWLYGSGFPKSMNISLMLDKKEGLQGHRGKAIDTAGKGSRKDIETNFEVKPAYTDFKSDLAKQWSGWGTALKPSFEPIIVARKPFKGSLVDNVIEYGVGGINIDECRVETEDDLYRKPCENGSIYSQQEIKYSTGTMSDGYKLGRFPANTILTYDDTDYEEVCGGFPDTKGNGNVRHNNNDGKGYNCYSNYGNCDTRGYEDSGSASRYFYCAKASKKDRDEGLEDTEGKPFAMTNQAIAELKRGNINFKTDSMLGTIKIKKNFHPTVKPTELMQYLIRLVSPDGATILDPFNGSGSTGKAVMYENKERNKNYKYVGIELTEEYLPISKARIEHLIDIPEESTKEENVIEGQMSIFDFMKSSDGNDN